MGSGVGPIAYLYPALPHTTKVKLAVPKAPLRKAFTPSSKISPLSPTNVPFMVSILFFNTQLSPRSHGVGEKGWVSLRDASLCPKTKSEPSSPYVTIPFHSPFGSQNLPTLGIADFLCVTLTW